MTELIQAMRAEANKERERAREIYGEINHDDHQSYAIILEQYDEACSDRAAVDISLNTFWALVKRDKEGTLERAKDKKECLKTIELHALTAAAEFIQVAAMARKAIITINNRTDEEE